MEYKKIDIKHRSFFGGMLGEVGDTITHKAFDFDKAVDIINQYQMKNVAAGLAEDWTHTHAQILKDGKPAKKNRGHYLASRWATPTIHDLDNPNYTFECYKEIPAEEAEGNLMWWTDEALTNLGFKQDDMVDIEEDMMELFLSIFDMF